MRGSSGRDARGCGGDARLSIRFGIYVDAVYRVTERTGEKRVSADPVDSAFLLFAVEVGRAFERIVLFGRTVRGDAPPEYLPLEAVEVVELPYYGSLRELGGLARTSAVTVRELWRGLRRVDAVWVFGPHPFALALVLLAVARRKRVVLGVRQDTVAYYRGRLPSSHWRPFMLAAHALDLSYRLLSRAVRTTVVGSEIGRRYGDRPSVLPMTVSLVRADDVVPHPPERDWTERIELLSVGRLEPEKNPLLLVDALAVLEREYPGRFRLTWLGDGRLRNDFGRRAAELHVAHLVDLRGFVPFGPELLAFYRSAHVFVHVSLTEGVPQVVTEALASGTPVVATDVGGVAASLEHGRAGLLVPPLDAAALVRGILTIVEDEDLRRDLVGRGLELARMRTLDSEAERVALFIRG